MAGEAASFWGLDEPAAASDPSPPRGGAPHINMWVSTCTITSANQISLRAKEGGVSHILRVTVNSEPGFTQLRVEGSLTQASAEELKKCWLNILRSIRRQHVIIVELTDLANIDGLGKKVLLEMWRRGVKLIGSGVMTKAVIEEIANTPPPRAQ